MTTTATATKILSFAPEVIADASGTWSGNGLRFATAEEAEVWVLDLMNRWYLVTDTRVVPSTDTPNRAMVNDPDTGRWVLAVL